MIARWCLVPVLAVIGLSAAPAWAEEFELPNGSRVTLPEGWRHERTTPAKGEDGLIRVHFVCETERCRRTLETCTFLMRQQERDGETDEKRVIALYRSPFDRYTRIRAVLKSTSQDAGILQTLERVAIGPRSWYVIETDARHNKKSGFFAETVIGDWYVGAICKTCETGPVRHQAGRDMLAGLQAAD